MIHEYISSEADYLSRNKSSVIRAFASHLYQVSKAIEAIHDENGDANDGSEEAIFAVISQQDVLNQVIYEAKRTIEELKRLVEQSEK